MKPLLAALCVLVAALPAGASVREPKPTLTVVEIPVRGERALASTRLLQRFDLVGLHWQGSGSVSFRARRLAGGWSSWRTAAPEVEDRPDVGSAEAGRSSGWHLGSPWWVGASDRVEYRLRGEVTRLRAFLVTSPAERTVSRTLSTAGSPPIVMRAGWNADESIRREPPQYADSLRLAVVHHTAGGNDYTQEDAPAVVRAIELYHVKGNGWNDIGYNFLVDRFGTVYEGRYGGVDKNVVGAHALGFNHGSVGVAVIGTYVDTTPAQAVLDALARLLAWRLDLAHVDPLSLAPVISGGSERYPAGTSIGLRAISGHTDTGLTACPGRALYAKLGVLSARAQSIGLPKIYSPLVTGQLGREVRVQANVSGPRPWTVTVADQTGATVASGNGVGPTVDWAWDATTAASGSYTWQIAVAGATPATGTLGTTEPVTTTLELTGAAVDPKTISPNGDRVADAATVTYTTTAPATVTVAVVDASGRDIAVIHGPVDEPAGPHLLSFTADGLVDGQYTLRIDATDAERAVSRTVTVLVTRTLGDVTVSPSTFSPNGDGRADRLSVAFTLLGPASVRVRVLREGRWIATPFGGELAAGRRVVRWDGSKRVGRLLDGSYTASVDATDAVGTSSLALPFTSDTRAPMVRILPGGPLRVWVSEPALLTLRVNGHALSATARSTGVLRVPWTRAAARVRVVAWDTAGNVSRPVLRP